MKSFNDITDTLYVSVESHRVKLIGETLDTREGNKERIAVHQHIQSFKAFLDDSSKRRIQDYATSNPMDMN